MESTEYKEREQRILRCARLFKAKKYIKDMKNEKLNKSILERLETVYVDMLGLKCVTEDIAEMDKEVGLSANQMQKRQVFVLIKDRFMEQIDEAVEFLESETYLLSVGSGFVAILDDLDRATAILTARVRNYATNHPKNS